LVPIASPDSRDQSVMIHQDAVVSAAKLEQGQNVDINLKPERHGWLQVARGGVAINGNPLAQGDGAAISDESRISIVADEPSEVLFFDLA
jgi:redox-sensitive bicupin YhaK (pirin superfamily)